MCGIKFSQQTDNATPSHGNATFKIFTTQNYQLFENQIWKKLYVHITFVLYFNILNTEL